MSENGQVKIGREFFDKIKLDYPDWRWALVREFAQNCMDAPGSKRVEFTVGLQDGKTVLTASNDGSPMDRDTLINKLLTLGGSGKNFEGENTGGFGVAKSLLYYTHKSYAIRTGNLLVHGSGAQYELTEDGAHVGGTCSTVTLEGDEVEALSRAVRRFASLAQWKGTLTLNAEVLATSMAKGFRRRDMGWGIVYTNQQANNLCLVRLNGQPMFTRWTRFKGMVLVELTGKAKDCLTSNRDALNGKLDSELSDLLTALAVDKKSALREQRAEYKRYHGERQRNEAKQPKAAEQGTAALIGGTRLLEKVLGVVAVPAEPQQVIADGGKAPTTSEQGGIKLVVVSKEDEEDRTISLGPEFILKNTTGLKVPVYYTPGEKFSDYSRGLVRAWCGLLLKLHQLCNVSGEFSVGFVFDDESEAECERGPYGRVYYLNPVKIGETENGKRKMEARFDSAWADRHELISLAAHEFVHGGYGLKEHDEDYAGRLTDVMTIALKHCEDLSLLCRPEAEPKGEARERTTLFGHAPTAIIRWMGTQGWNFARAKDALIGLGIQVADGTIKAQLYGGAKGTRGDVPELTPEQRAELER